MKPPEREVARWYDKYPNLKSLITVTGELPRSIQDSIGENMISTINRYQRLLQDESELRSLGSDVVLGLYKSHKRQRWYDSVPAMHKAFNLLLSLPDPALLHLDDRCAGLVEYIRGQQSASSLNASSMVLKVHKFLHTREFIEIRDESGHIVREQVQKGTPPLV
jgi:hypothetical protein